jgi:hypothetical protein
LSVARHHASSGRAQSRASKSPRSAIVIGKLRAPRHPAGVAERSNAGEPIPASGAAPASRRADHGAEIEFRRSIRRRPPRCDTRGASTAPVPRDPAPPGMPRQRHFRAGCPTVPVANDRARAAARGVRPGSDPPAEPSAAGSRHLATRSGTTVIAAVPGHLVLRCPPNASQAREGRRRGRDHSS